MPKNKKPQQAVIAGMLSIVLVSTLSISPSKLPQTLVHERHTTQIVQERLIAQRTQENLLIFTKAYEAVKASQRAQRLQDNLQTMKDAHVAVLAALEVEKARKEAERVAEEIRVAEEARVNRVALPIRESYWISDEYWAISSIRGYSPHTGLDFAVRAWAPIYPIAKGEVIFSGWGGVWGGCGYWTAVRHHGLGVDTVYCHQVEHPPVHVGQWVDPDTVIGYVGSTGLSTGAHLHFGVHSHELGGWTANSTIDPRAWLNSYGLNP